MCGRTYFWPGGPDSHYTIRAISKNVIQEKEYLARPGVPSMHLVSETNTDKYSMACAKHHWICPGLLVDPLVLRNDVSHRMSKFVQPLQYNSSYHSHDW